MKIFTFLFKQISFRKSTEMSSILKVMLLITPGCFFAQQTYSFTTCGATGNTGPIQSQANTAYASTNLNGSVTVSSGIQTFTVPVSGPYRIEARGAKGYGTNGGRGARIVGDFTLTAGTVFKILVGQQGVLPSNSSYNNQYGGGGGSFVTYTNNVPVIVAGGGGGSWAQSYSGLSDGTVTTSGNSGSNGPTNGSGGSGGLGGSSGGSADGGGGFTGSGSGGGGGVAFTSGGAGGVNYGVGGFGGGAGTSSYNNRRGGGGGGYSGGGGAGSTTTGYPEGGGGGSFNAATSQTNIAGANNGDGVVIITALCNVNVFASGSNSLAPVICSGNSLTLTTNATSNYSWSTGNTVSSVIVVSPSLTTTYSVSGTGSASCQGFAAITVTVSAAAPVLTIASTATNICQGMSVTFTASGALSYTWTGGVTNATPFTPSTTANYTVSGENGCGTVSSSIGVSVAPLPVTVTTPTNTVCYGFPTLLTASAAANSYTWLPVGITSGSTIGVSPTITTIYTVTADNGTCSGTGTISLAVVPVPTITSTSSSSNVCVGGSATLSASGANGYLWAPGNQTTAVIVVSPTTATLYSVVGTAANGCYGGASQIVIVSQPPNVNVSASSQIICSGESPTLIVTGTNSYTWSTSSTSTVITVSPSQNTTYSVVGQDNVTGCTNTAAIVVNVVTPTVSITGNSVICSGESVTLTATGANSYVWSNSLPLANNVVSPTVTTTYSVVGTANLSNISCTNSASYQVQVNPTPTVLAVADRTSICRSEQVILTASGASSYTWSNSQNTASISLTPTIITTLSYSVTGLDANGCSGIGTVSVKVNGCVGITEQSGANGVIIFPNPSSGDLNLHNVYNQEIAVLIYTELGQKLLTVELNARNNYFVRLSDLAPGVYFIKADGENLHEVRKIVITR